MNTIISILAALLLLGVLITVHEFGHYIVGRLLGFTILEFSVGMGPVLLQKKKNGIRYCLRCLPIGGMCRFAGEDTGSTEEEISTAENEAEEETAVTAENNTEDETPAPAEGAFYAQKRWKRFLVIAAGPVMNILFAILIAFVTLLAYGDTVPAVVEAPVASMPAEAAGIRMGDILVSVDGKKVSYIEDAIELLKAASPERVPVVIERDGKRQTLILNDIYDAEVGYNRAGITIGYASVKCGFFRAWGGSVRFVWNILRETFSFFGVLLRGQAKASDVSGVVGTVAVIGEVIHYGFESVLRLACLISASLAFTNLLPIPALDGGSLFFILVSVVIGKEIPPQKQGIINFIGLLLLLGLMIFITVNDVRNLIGG